MKSWEIDIKNYAVIILITINLNDLDLDNMLTGNKSPKKNLICDNVHKTSYSAKSFGIIFDKTDGYIRKYDKTSYLPLFIHEKKYEGIFDKIRYLMSESNISDVYSHKFL